MRSFCITLIVFAALSGLPGMAQWKEPPSTGSPQFRLEDRTYMAGQSGMAATLTAQLDDAEANAKQHKVVVRAQTDGIEVNDSAAANNGVDLDHALIQYQLDGSTPQNTASRSWTFASVSSGSHTVSVRLVTANNEPIADATRLHIRIP